MGQAMSEEGGLVARFQQERRFMLCAAAHCLHEGRRPGL